MSASRRFFFILLAALALFAWFMVHHESVAHKRAQLRIEEIARVVAPSVWSYDDQSHHPYLELAARSNHYTEATVLLPDGQEFMRVGGGGRPGTDLWLLRLGLIRQTELKAAVVHSGQRIGTVRASWLNQAIYLYSTAIAFICLGLVVIWMQLRLLDAKKALAGQVRDRTRELEEANEELRRLATAIDQAAEDVIITDAGGTIQYVNPAFEALTGYSRAEVIGRNPRLLQSGEHDRAFYEQMWSTITGGGTWSGRFVNRTREGVNILQDANTSPIKDSAGNLIGFVSVRRDVTEQVKLEQRLLQSQKMEAIGTLAGGIAHDINNILMAIMGYTELALMELGEDNSSHKYLNNVLNAGERVRDLVEQILTFSRQTQQEATPVKLRTIAAEVLRLVRVSLPSTIEIVDALDSDALVMADPTQLHQVLMNLCTNAEHAMRENGGTLTVKLCEMDISDPANARQLGVTPGRYVRLRVSDTGYGIPTQLQEKIFEPFFTTKEPGQGTGLGLSVVHGIVESYGGALKLDSETEQGAAFHIYLPVTTLPERNDEAPYGELPVGHERILFVDDEPMQGGLAEEGLSRMGYQVTALASSEAALELFAEDSQAFDLVITDMTMPRMTGDKLARKLLSMRPDLPVLMCTGFSEKINENQALQLGIRGFVRKPIMMSALGRKIREVLDHPSA